MPAVRDYTFSYEASTADAGLNIPMCGYATNDLLVMFAVADTGTPTWVVLSDVTGAASEDAATPVDDSTDAASTTANDMELTPAAGNAGVGDGYYFGYGTPFNMVRVNVGTNGSAVWTITWKYWNGAWTNIPGVTDGSTGWTAGTGNRDITFNPPPDWTTTTVVSKTRYWVKAEITAFTSLTTRPLGTQAWVRTWTQLFGRNNTLASICYFKISAADETDITITTATNETYNGSVTSIRDINTSSPFNVTSTASYSETNTDTYASLGNGTITGVAQSFTNSAFVTTLAKAIFYLKKNGSPTGNAVAKLYAHSGTLGTSSVPTGVALATSDNFDVSTLTTSAQLVTFTFSSFKNWYAMAASTNYVLSIEYSGGNVSNYVQVGYDGSTPGHGGNYSENTGAWAANSGRDLSFYLQTFNPTDSTQAASARFAMPTITTEVNDSLVLYFNATSGSAGTPSIIEGPVFSLIAGDGSAESHAVGWGFQRTAGTTANNVYATAAVTGAGVKAVFQISPPSGGATVIPAYTPQDDCTYIDPIAGVSAYNTNTALAATADTNYGTSLGGFTANDATVAAMTDTGLNSFHSLGGLTNAATAKTISGAELVIAAANRFNMGTKNLLCHVYAATPAHMQRFASVSSNRGFWMGVRSNTASGGATTGYKIWQVHGVEAPWDYGFHVPIIINTGAANTKATSGTLDTAVITSVGFWTSGIGALTAQMGVGSLWLMDKTVICGGNATEPLDVPGIVKTISRGKERQSGILQGARQMLLLQDIQIGNGGTNPVYLDLDATATEFPRQYNAATAQVNYNSTDNVIGITYYAGASDTIKHHNSVISSNSKYKWVIHASSSTSATYDFDGLIIIGAGTVTLKAGITFTGVTWSSCDVFDSVGATLTNCFIESTTGANALTVTSTANMALITNTSFSSNARAIKLTTAGTYTFSGITFTSNTYDIENNSAGTNADTYSESNQNASQALGNGTITKIGQSITGNGATLANAQFYLSKTGTPTGNMTVNIYAHSGVFGTSSVPTGAALATSQTFDVATLTGSLTLTDIFFIGEGRTTGDNNITLTNSTNYVVTLEYSGGDGSNYVNVGVDTSTPSHGGNFSTYNGSWSAVSGTDACFRVRTGGIIVINAQSGSNPSQSKVINSNAIPGSTTINNSVNLTVTVINSNTDPIPTAQVAIFRTSDNSELMNEDTETVTAGSFVVGVKYTIVTVGTTDFTSIGASSNTVGLAFTATGVGTGTGTASNGIAVQSFTYESDTSIYIRVRKSSTGETKYVPLSTTGTITSNGYSLTATLSTDTVA